MVSWRRSVPLCRRDILTSVPRQDFIDKGLIPDATATCFFTELIEHSGIDSNRDQLATLVAERRPALAEAPAAR